MDVYEFVAANQRLIDARDWEGYEEAAREAARALTSKRRVQKAADIDLSGYVRALEDLIRVAVVDAESRTASALYFEYDLDNGWESGAFFCRSFEPSIIPFVEWPADFEDHVDGPALPQFSRAFRRYGWEDSPESNAVVILTVARTIAAFGRALGNAGPGPLPWAIGFHDQDPIVPLVDPRRRSVDTASLRRSLAGLDTPAAREALRLMPDDAVEASTCTARRMRWSWKFKMCDRFEWRTLGGEQLMANMPDEATYEAVGWSEGSRRVVLLGDAAETPSYCVVFEEDPAAEAIDGATYDDLDVLAAPADEAYLNSLRRLGIDPHR